MRPLISILLIGLAGALPVAHAASPPTSVQATQGKFPTTVRITWNAVAGATAYEVRRSESNDYNTATAIASGVSQASYEDSVMNNKVYIYWVIAQDAQGPSSPSTPVTGYRDFEKFGNCDSDSVTDGTLKDQCDTLVSLYDSTNGPNWFNSSNWKVTSKPCSWYGVICRDGYVSYIQRRSSNLKGTLPNLSALTKLYRLELNHNKLSGSLPASLNALTNLQTLDLSDNLLSGSIPNLNALVNLQTLDLQNNQLSGSIPDLSNLVDLRNLYLNDNQLSGAIPDLSALKSLSYLGLQNNQLSGPIPALPGSLSRLYLQNNQLSGEIPASLGSLERLSYLYLNDNKLCGTIPPSLVDLGRITLALDNNHLIATDPTLITWLNEKAPGWEKAQTPLASCDSTVIDPTPVITYSLTVSNDGTGTGKVTGNGIDCGSECTEVYEENKRVTLTATSANDAIFAGWSDACSGTATTCQVTMSQAQVVTATFNSVPTYQLTVSKEGTGSGKVTANGLDCGSDCTEQYAENTQITLTATPSADSAFAAWTGACTGTESTCQVTLTEAQTVTATFNLVKHSLTVSKDGTGSGNVTGNGINCGSTCTQALTQGTRVTLTANASADSVFAGWTGACTGTATRCQMTLTEAQTVTATFNLRPPSTYQLTVNKGGTGSGNVTADGLDCGNTCTKDYVENTQLTLTATPSADSMFAKWDGACTGTATTCQVTLTEAQTVTATFNLRPPSTYQLTVNKGGTGSGNVTADGIDCGNTCTKDYVENTQLTLTATPSADSMFAKWDGACTGTATTCQVTLTEAQTVTATFNLRPPSTYQLTVNKGGTGSGNVTADGLDCGNTCTKDYVENTQLTLTATPSADSMFAKWDGACTGTATTCQVTLTEAQTVTATFNLRPPSTYQLTVNKGGTGSGNVTADGLDCGNTCTKDYVENTQLTLTATPSADSLFAGWTGACAGTESTCQVTLNQAQTVTATFNLRPPSTYQLTVNKDGTGSGNVTADGINCGNTCTKDYVENTQLTLTATPSADSLFAGWTGACAGTESTCQVTLNQAQTVTATFNLRPPSTYQLTVNKDGTGSGNVTADGINCGNTCTKDYVENTQLTLTATPSADSLFAGWTGACAGTEACKVTMDQGQTVKATFKSVPRYELTLSKDGTGSGRVTGQGIYCGDDCSEEYPQDTQVTLTAMPSVDSTLVSWEGACSGNETSCVVSISQAQTVTVIFALIQPRLIVIKDGTGTGHVTDGEALDCGENCEAAYDEETPVTLTATASDNATFAGWNGACAGTATTCEISMDQDKIVTATFNLLDGNGPEACFTFSYSETPLTVELDASCSVKENRAITHYQWQTSDGQTASEQHGNFTFEVPNKYTITLTVTDDKGATGTSTQVIIFDEELVFTGLKHFYKVGETIIVDLVENLAVSSRFERVDLWVAIQMPNGSLNYRTPFPQVPFSPEQQPFRLSLQIQPGISHRILEFEVIPGFGGDYTLYGLYVQEGKNPLVEPFFVVQRSNLARATTVLSNR